MSEHQSYFEANRDIWNQRTIVHRDSPFYNLEEFKKGEMVLSPIEQIELGEVKNKSILRLQCHFGMDSLDRANFFIENECSYKKP